MSPNPPGPLSGLGLKPFDLGTLVRTNSPVPGPIAATTGATAFSGPSQVDLALMRRALPYAEIAQAVYTASAVRCLEGNFDVVDGSVVRKGSFLSAVYSRGNETVLAFAGTDYRSAADWVTDLQNWALGSGQEGNAYAEVFQTLPEAADRRITVVGHSLGGNLALLASLGSGWPCYTFNSEGLGPFMWAISHIDKWTHNIRSGDILNFVMMSDNIIVRLSRIIPLPGRTIVIPDVFNPRSLINPIYAKGHDIGRVIERMRTLTKRL